MSANDEWNGRDWGVNFSCGSAVVHRIWDDAVTYGFISAGAGAWYSRTLRSVPVGARIFVNSAPKGYVGVGEVTGEPAKFIDAVLEVDGRRRRLVSLPVQGDYRYPDDDSDDIAEWVLPVRWLKTVPLEKAFWVTGLRGNQNSAFRLKHQFTIDHLAAHFGVDA